jgi:hypothetical protein
MTVQQPASRPQEDGDGRAGRIPQLTALGVWLCAEGVTGSLEAFQAAGRIQADQAADHRVYLGPGRDPRA